MLPYTAYNTLLRVSSTFLSAVLSERVSELVAMTDAREMPPLQYLQIRAEQLAFASAMCQIWL